MLISEGDPFIPSKIEKSRKNLQIIKNTYVKKIIFKNKVAVGVEYIKNNKIEKFYANKEVILSAGSINSPQILQL